MVAKEYYDAAEILMDSDEIPFVIHPIIVNYSFACELAIKAVEGKIIRSKTYPGGLLSAVPTLSNIRGHKLSTLFTDLSPKSQKRLLENYKTISKNDLEEELDKYSEYFESARYSFEKVSASFDITGIRTLASDLLAAVKLIKT